MLFAQLVPPAVAVALAHVEVEAGPLLANIPGELLQIDHFNVIIADSEFEALVLECSLIKRHQPRYNILLKDSKGYPYQPVPDLSGPLKPQLLRRPFHLLGQVLLHVLKPAGPHPAAQADLDPL